ncbi:unnamed protein product [Didymodactylos carnosus]|uniref:Uncharacterized protein n=1 Tax=Didymodactylos carnosus TaxID=1234261 RepID=A0A814X2R9_9BILA|nr:unnamed protein product [Didymodactylos carnosus]CAF3974268.1 unnamed protein product [Didymodactylos carnosus]
MINVTSSATLTKTLPTSCSVKLNYQDFETLKSLQKPYYERQMNNLIYNNASETNEKKRYNGYEHIPILLKYFKQYTPYCSGVFKNKKFGTLRNTTVGLLCVISSNIYCKQKECAFYCRAIVKTNCFIYIYIQSSPRSKATQLNQNKENQLTNEVNHKSYPAARPIQKPERLQLETLMNKGVTQHHIFFEQKNQRTVKEKCGYNYDSCGTSIRTLKKIKADFKSQAYKAQNEDDSIRHI